MGYRLPSGFHRLGAMHQTPSPGALQHSQGVLHVNDNVSAVIGCRHGKFFCKVFGLQAMILVKIGVLRLFHTGVS